MTQAQRRCESVTADWGLLQSQIDGVVIKEVRSVLGGGGALAELWRRDWALDQGGIEQVFAKRMAARAVSGWHVHLEAPFDSYGDHDCVRMTREGLGWYAKDQPETARCREIINVASAPQHQLDAIRAYFGERFGAATLPYVT